VARDFVEFPSKLMEHWISDAALLAPMGVPPELIAAIARADDYGQGFATVELTAASLVDLALHRSSEGVDPMAFADHLLDSLAMPPMIVMRHQLPVFTHIFDGGYASAYYSYLWSEMLDWDAFRAFTEKGNIFDARTGTRFRTEILARGDSRDPAMSFAAFRGRPPRAAFLLAARGLIDQGAAEPADGSIAEV
jgi:peptidyl-dipeptidase Dcp